MDVISKKARLRDLLLKAATSYPEISTYITNPFLY